MQGGRTGLAALIWRPMADLEGINLGEANAKMEQKDLPSQTGR